MSSLSQNKVAIFDLGNVVLDWDVDRVLDSLDLEAEVLTLLRKELFFHRDWLEMDRGTVSETAVVSNISKRSPLQKNAVKKAILAAKNSLQPIPETIKLMEDISNNGIKMFCLSNMSRETYAHIKNMEFFGMFRDIIISGITGCMKPSEDIFRLAIDRFELDPSCSLFIDDSLPNIETARRLGIKGFHFKGSHSCYKGIRSRLLHG
ncbi:MAG: HAD family phosphatase [Pyrinomonadaceae bacterium]|nr:HAD family phosphatase [Pyrinomonadaceae bacterium]